MAALANLHAYYESVSSPERRAHSAYNWLLENRHNLIESGGKGNDMSEPPTAAATWMPRRPKPGFPPAPPRVVEAVDSPVTAVPPGQISQPLPRDRPTPPRPSPLGADCVVLDPERLSISERGERWTLGNENRLLVAAPSPEEARRVRAVIERYGADQRCFVGRPAPSFQYLLVDNRAPSGAMRGEVCIGFSLSRLALSQVRGSWRIVEGWRSLFSFPNRCEALEALAVIHYYGFTQTCYVGRTAPSLVTSVARTSGRGQTLSPTARGGGPSTARSTRAVFVRSWTPRDRTQSAATLDLELLDGVYTPARCALPSGRDSGVRA